MNLATAVACAIFTVAIVLESTVRMTFFHHLRTRHPQQWTHARRPIPWQVRALPSARSTMLYLQNREYLASLDEEGMRFCARHRKIVLIAYWLTVSTGVGGLLSLTFFGW